MKQIVQDYEENIIQPPLEFRDDYKPTIIPHTKKTKLLKPIPSPRTKKQIIKLPILLPRTIIQETNKALKGYTKTYEISIKNNKDPITELD